MTPKEQAKYYLDQTNYHPEDYAARDTIKALLDELESIEATTGALKVCHSLRGAVMEARKQAAKEACRIAAENGCVDHRFMCAVRTSKAIADHFGLEI